MHLLSRKDGENIEVYLGRSASLACTWHTPAATRLTVHSHLASYVATVKLIYFMLGFSCLYFLHVSNCNWLRQRSYLLL